MMKSNKGFSLIELIVVVAIMAVLTGVLAPQFIKYVDKARRQKDLSTVMEMLHVVEILNTEYVAYNYSDLIDMGGYWSFEFSRKAIIEGAGSEEAFFESLQQAEEELPDGVRFFMVDFFKTIGYIPEASIGEEYGWVFLFNTDAGGPVFAGLYNSEEPNKHYVLYPSSEDFMNGITVTDSQFNDIIMESLGR